MEMIRPALKMTMTEVEHFLATIEILRKMEQNADFMEQLTQNDNLKINFHKDLPEIICDFNSIATHIELEESDDEPTPEESKPTPKENETTEQEFCSTLAHIACGDCPIKDFCDDDEDKNSACCCDDVASDYYHSFSKEEIERVMKIAKEIFEN